jgi:flagellar FliJ protein
MASLHAFEVAVELAQRRRDAARQQLHASQGARDAAQEQLDQLEGYAGEIQQRWGMGEGRSMQPEVLFHHYQFLDRLEHTIGLQQGVVGNQDARVAQSRQELQQTELRLASLRKALERRRQQQQSEQQRREQKQTDERALQRLGAGMGAWDQEQ